MESLIDQLRINKEIDKLSADPVPRNWNVIADDIMTKDPEGYLEIVQLIADGNSIDKVNRLTKVQKTAIRAIKDRHPAALEGYRASLVRNVEEAAQLVTERMIDSIDEISPNKLMFAVDVLIKNGLLLSGQATSRIETIEVKSPEELQKMYESLPSAE